MASANIGALFRRGADSEPEAGDGFLAAFVGALDADDVVAGFGETMFGDGETVLGEGLHAAVNLRDVDRVRRAFMCINNGTCAVDARQIPFQGANSFANSARGRRGVRGGASAA